jgi:hypothetical protein
MQCKMRVLGSIRKCVNARPQLRWQKQSKGLSIGIVFIKQESQAMLTSLVFFSIFQRRGRRGMIDPKK